VDGAPGVGSGNCGIRVLADELKSIQRFRETIKIPLDLQIYPVDMNVHANYNLLN